MLDRRESIADSSSEKNSQSLNCPACHSADARRIVYLEGTIAICRECRLQWSEGVTYSAATDPVEAMFHTKYMDPSDDDAQTYKPYQDFFDKIDKFGKNNGRILDVGCGNGKFVAACLDKGLDAWGIEANKKMAAMMTPAVRERVHFEMVETFSHPNTKYSVVTFWDSFEHLPNPFDLLATLRDFLEPDGVVFLRVNNSWDIYNLTTLAALKIAPPIGKKLLKSCFSLPAHFWNFSYDPMTAMCKRDNWHVLHHRVTETPASRFSDSAVVRSIIAIAYFLNRLIAGGKIGEYYLRDNVGARPESGILDDRQAATTAQRAAIPNDTRSKAK